MTERDADRTNAPFSAAALRLHPKLRFFSSCAAGVVFAISAIILVGGWWFDVEVLRTFALRSASVLPNTALGLAGAGAALWLQGEDLSPVGRIAGRTLAGLPLGIGLLTLGEYLAGRSFGIDALLVPRLQETGAGVAAMRPWFATALALALLGLSLVTLDSASRRGWRIADLFGLCAALLALAGSLGYLIEGPAGASVNYFVTMAPPTTLGVLLIAAGLLTARPDSGLSSDILALRQGAAAQPRLWMVGLFGALALVGYSASLAWLHAASARTTSEWIVRSYEVELDLTELLSALKDVEVGSRGLSDRTRQCLSRAL